MIPLNVENSKTRTRPGPETRLKTEQEFTARVSSVSGWGGGERDGNRASEGTEKFTDHQSDCCCCPSPTQKKKRKLTISVHTSNSFPHSNYIKTPTTGLNVPFTNSYLHNGRVF